MGNSVMTKSSHGAGSARQLMLTIGAGAVSRRVVPLDFEGTGAVTDRWSARSTMRVRRWALLFAGPVE